MCVVNDRTVSPFQGLKGPWVFSPACLLFRFCRPHLLGGALSCAQEVLPRLSHLGILPCLACFPGLL